MRRSLKLTIGIIGCLASILVLSASPPACAQKGANVSGKKVMIYPSAYDNPTGNILADSYEKKGTSWIVFSDRAENPTFTSPKNNAKQLKTMGFMDAFYVIDETDVYLRLVKYDPQAKENNNQKLNGKAIDYGWVDKRKMLLWHKSLVNSSNSFRVKALAINTPESIKEPKKYVNEANLKIFEAPGLDQKFKNDKDVRIFDFLYIYKKDPTSNSVLIGKSEFIRPNSAQLKIFGWVSKEIVQVWEQRLTLEPNWDGSAIKERQASSLKTTLVASKEAAADFSHGNSVVGTQILWDKDPYGEKPDANWKRLPVLSDPNNQDGVIQTGVVTPVFDKSGKIVISGSEQIQLEEEYNELRDEYRNINMVFVVDGTSGMIPFIEPIINALKGSTNTIKASENHYRFGAVIYRDYSLESCETIETKSLNLNMDRTTEFLRQKLTSSSDCEPQQNRRAINEAVTKAARMMSGKANQTNYIIVVGDAGNYKDESEENLQQIINQITENNCRLLAFQVRNAHEEEYDDFFYQMQDIILESSRKIAKKGDRDIRPKFIESVRRNTYQLNFPATSPVPGVLTHADKGGVMPLDQLRAEIIAMIELVEVHHNEILDGMDAKIKGQGEKKVMNEGIYSFLSRFGVGEDLLRRASYDNLQFFVRGYTALTVTNMKYPLYKYVLFMDEDELGSLKRTMKDLFISGTGSDKYAQMRNIYYETLSSFYGPREAKRFMKSKSIKEILTLITGLPLVKEEGCLLCRYTPNDIDPELLSEQDFGSMMDYIDEKLTVLDQISGDDRYSFRSNDRTYYWIPQELLP